MLQRLPKSLCVDKPDLDIIAKGAMILDLEYKIIEDAAYPSNSNEKNGCVRVEKGKMKKTTLLSKIGETLVKNS